MVEKVLNWCKEKYPDLEPIVVKNTGEICITFLYNPDHNWLSGCKVVYYNRRYTNEFNVSGLVNEDC